MMTVSALSFLLGVSSRRMLPRVWYKIIFRRYSDKCLLTVSYLHSYIYSARGGE